MQVRKTFAKRMAAQAEGIPREVIANLLVRLMPRIPVVTKKPSELPPPPTRDAFTGQARRTRTRRTKRVIMSSYVVTSTGQRAKHRGWRGAMVRAAQLHDNKVKAEQWLGDNYPEYRTKGIDWAWLETTVNYISTETF
jgi:hypothetical protein